MSLDRFVRFDEKYPTQEGLRRVLENFLGGTGTVEWQRDRFFVELPGNPTLALEGFPDTISCSFRPEGRWIEVWYKDRTLDVITREADDFTNALASSLAEICARYWRGKLEK